jgi:hypothetical protein
MTSAKDREEFLLQERARIDAELASLRTDVGEYKPPVPEAHLDVVGHYTGNPYPIEQEYRVILRADEDYYVVEVETTGGDQINRLLLNEDRAQDVLSSLNSDQDDPRGAGVGIYYETSWQVGDIPNDIVIRGAHIEEVTRWFEYATGADEWDWDEQGEEWMI